MVSNDYKIETWFPKSVLLVDNLLMDRLSTYSFVLEKIFQNNVTNRNNFLKVDSLHDTDFKLENHPEFNGLIEAISSFSKIYSDKLGFRRTLALKNIWANISYQNDYLLPHVHPNSIISGVFYIEAPAESTITFFDNINTMFDDAEEPSYFSYKHCTYECKPGRLLLFKSDFLHGTSSQPEGRKIVVSFNIN
jgi:uncharacterized protein (TIGR02466 family)